MTRGALPDDDAGWRQLVRRVARITRRPDEARDCLHSAFIRLEEYRRSHPVDNPSAFLVRTAVNIGVDEVRRAQVRSAGSGSEFDLEVVADLRPLQDEVFAVRERLQRVGANLARMNARTREIFLMHRLGGMKYREIAQSLGVTVSAVEKHIAKATLLLTEWSHGEPD
jgi:RNA polymerase sigma-70 factor (ECF subfamily)